MNSHSLPFGIGTRKVNSILPHIRDHCNRLLLSITHHTYTPPIFGSYLLNTYYRTIICKIQNLCSVFKPCNSTLFSEDFLLCFLNLEHLDCLPINVSIPERLGFCSYIEPSWSWCIVLLSLPMGYSMGFLCHICSKISMIETVYSKN